MIDSVHFLASLLIFDISLLYYYVNLRSSTIFFPFSGDIYLSLDISVSLSTVSEIFRVEFLETFGILLAILLPIKSLVPSDVF